MMQDLVSNPGMMKSPVWVCFSFVLGTDGQLVNEEKPVCVDAVRGQTVDMKESNTFNLLSHLRNAHPTFYRPLKGNIDSAAAAKCS